MKYLFPIGLSLLFCNISFSQEIWTLQDCIQFAMENNAEIKKQSCRNTISRLELERSKFDHLPTVTARIDHNLSSGRSLNTESYSWESSTKQQGNVIISSGLMIFNAFNKYYENREYFYSYLHENQSLKVIERDVTIKILSKYFEILFYHEQVDIYANQLDLSEKNISRITELIRSGHLAEGELFEVRSQTLKEEKQLTETKNRLDICYSDLYRLINNKEDEFLIERTDIEKTVNDRVMSSDTLLHYIEIYDPEMKKYNASISVHEFNLKKTRSERYPALSLNGSVSSRYLKDATDPTGTSGDLSYPFIDQLQNNLYNQLSVSLTIPVFNNFQYRQNIQNAKYNLEIAKTDREQAYLELTHELKNLFKETRISFESYTISILYFETTEKSFMFSEEKFAAGLINAYELNLSKNKLIDAHYELIQAKYKYYFNCMLMEIYEGSLSY